MKFLGIIVNLGLAFDWVFLNLSVISCNLIVIALNFSILFVVSAVCMVYFDCTAIKVVDLIESELFSCENGHDLRVFA